MVNASPYLQNLGGDGLKWRIHDFVTEELDENVDVVILAERRIHSRGNGQALFEYREQLSCSKVP